MNPAETPEVAQPAAPGKRIVPFRIEPEKWKQIKAKLALSGNTFQGFVERKIDELLTESRQ